MIIYIIYLLLYRYFTNYSLIKYKGHGEFTIFNFTAIHPLEDGLRQRNIAQGRYSLSFRLLSQLVQNTSIKTDTLIHVGIWYRWIFSNCKLAYVEQRFTDKKILNPLKISVFLETGVVTARYPTPLSGDYVSSADGTKKAFAQLPAYMWPRHKI